MELSPEEIKEAQEQSGDATPTPEELEEWKKIHQQLNQDLAEREENRSGIINLNKVIIPMFDPYVDKKTLTVIHGRGTSTVLELLRNKKSGACFPWCKSEILGYESITEAALEGAGEFELVTVLCQYLCKLVEIKKGDTEKLEYWIKRFAGTFRKLAENDKIKYGMLSTFMALPLADFETESRIQKEYVRILKEISTDDSWKDGSGFSKKIEEMRAEGYAKATTRRILLMVYPYSHYEREELNEWLGNPAFVEEGEIGSDDWDGLP